MNKQKPVAWAKRSIITGEINGVSLSENTELKSQTLEPLYLAAPQATDTDKVREAINGLMDFSPSKLAQPNGMTRGGPYVRKADVLDLIDAMAAQAPVREVPGWKLVPLEVTDAMLEAWKTELCVPIGSSPEAKARRAYRAMLAVAPMHKEKNNE